MYVRDWMSSDVIGVGPDESVFDAKRLLHEHCIRHLPVVREGRLIGVVSQRDLLGASLHIAQTIEEPTRYLAEIKRAKVRDYMAHAPLTVAPDDPIEKAARLMRDQKIGCLPVVADGRLVGVLTETDLFDTLVRSLGLEEGEKRMVFDLDLGDPQRTMQQIVDWLLVEDLSMTSLVTYQARTAPRPTRILVRATPCVRAGG